MTGRETEAQLEKPRECPATTLIVRLIIWLVVRLRMVLRPYKTYILPTTAKSREFGTWPQTFAMFGRGTIMTGQKIRHPRLVSRLFLQSTTTCPILWSHLRALICQYSLIRCLFVFCQIGTTDKLIHGRFSIIVMFISAFRLSLLSKKQRYTECRSDGQIRVCYSGSSLLLSW